MGWRDTISEAQPSGSWRDTVKVDAPDVSQVESGLRGTSQGISMGFDDEIAGGLSVLGRPLGIKGLGGKLSDIELTSPTLDTDEILGEYSRVRDLERGNNSAAEKANPGTYLGGQIAGGVGGSVLMPGLNAAKGASLATMAGKGALQGGLNAAGLSNADSVGDFAIDTGIGTILGGGTGAAMKGVEKASDIVTPHIKNLMAKGAGGAKSAAEKLAVKATGATGRQAEGFADDAGRQLLDRKLVQFGDSPENIATRLQDKIDEAGEGIRGALERSRAQGAKVDIFDYLDKSEKEVLGLRQLGKFLEADALEAQTNKLIENADRLGVTSFDPITMENIKRESQAGINYLADAKPAIAGKKLGASMQRQSVEDAMTGLDPKLGAKFKDEKSLYGLLSPIQEAAEKRASQLNQSPFGGLGDTAAHAAGQIAGAGPLSGVATAAGRRAIAPRLASSAAVSLDKVGDILQASPQVFGKYANVLQQASARGPQGVASTHFLLQQTEPDYRMMLDKIANDKNEIEEVGHGYPER